MIPQSKTWKNTYIRALVTLAGPWGGSVRALSIFAVGDNLGNWLLSEKKLMWEQRTSSSLAWLMPQKGFWDPADVLVQTTSTNYTVEDYQKFFSDLDEPLAWNMREDTMQLLPGLPAPEVEAIIKLLSSPDFSIKHAGFLHTWIRGGYHWEIGLWRRRVPGVWPYHDQRLGSFWFHDPKLWSHEITTIPNFFTMINGLTLPRSKVGIWSFLDPWNHHQLPMIHSCQL